MWSVATDGHCQWGGWKTEGRERFKLHKKSIHKARKQGHVPDLERSTLEQIKQKLNLKQEDEKKTKAAPISSQAFDPKFMDSDDEDSDDASMPEAEDGQGSGDKDGEKGEASPKKRAANPKTTGEDESSEEEEEENEGDDDQGSVEEE